MSIDLNFWKYQNGACLDHAAVYQNACCENERVEGLEDLPVEDILKAIADAFCDWNAMDSLHYEKKEGQGSFEIQATRQMVRFDCYSMERADMKRFSSVMSEFGCPLYDPQQGVRFDKMAILLVDDAGEYKMQAERELSRLLPRLEVTTRVVSWEKYVQLSKEIDHIIYNAVIHRAKTVTKVTSFMKFGNAWANRPCQCKTAQLVDKEQADRILEELLLKSIGRVVNDFLERTYYG